MNKPVDRTSNVLGWISIIISGLTLIVSILTLIAVFLHFLSVDRGPLTAKTKLDLSTKDDIYIVCRLYDLCFEPHIEIYNDGKIPEKIGRMIAYISSDNSKIRKILIPFSYIPYGGNESRSFGSFVVRPGELWNAKVSFSEEYTEKQRKEITELDIGTGEYLQKEIMNIKDDKKFKPILSDDLYLKLHNVMQSQVSWLKEGNYRLLLFVIGGQDNKELLFRKAWSFTLSELQVKALTELQIDSYRMSPKTGSKEIMVYPMAPRIKEVTDIELISLVDEFDKEPKGKDLSGINYKAQPKY